MQDDPVDLGEEIRLRCADTEEASASNLAVTRNGGGTESLPEPLESRGSKPWYLRLVVSGASLAVAAGLMIELGFSAFAGQYFSGSLSRLALERFSDPFSAYFLFLGYCWMSALKEILEHGLLPALLIKGSTLWLFVLTQANLVALLHAIGNKQLSRVRRLLWTAMLTLCVFLPIPLVAGIYLMTSVGLLSPRIRMFGLYSFLGLIPWLTPALVHPNLGAAAIQQISEFSDYPLAIVFFLLIYSFILVIPVFLAIQIRQKKTRKIALFAVAYFAIFYALNWLPESLSRVLSLIGVVPVLMFAGYFLAAYSLGWVKCSMREID